MDFQSTDSSSSWATYDSMDFQSTDSSSSWATYESMGFGYTGYTGGAWDIAGAWAAAVTDFNKSLSDWSQGINTIGKQGSTGFGGDQSEFMIWLSENSPALYLGSVGHDGLMGGVQAFNGASSAMELESPVTSIINVTTIAVLVGAVAPFDIAWNIGTAVVAAGYSVGNVAGAAYDSLFGSSP